MPRHLLSPRAQSDLDAIWDYGAERWGEDRAATYVGALWLGVEAVAHDSRRGRACGDIRAGINVIRILHQRMDFDRHL